MSLLNKIIAYGFVGLFLLMLLAISCYYFHSAWIEWELSEKIIQEGISAQAVVQSCIWRRGNCSTTYEYKVPSSDDKIQTYTVRERGCSCRKGEQVTIFYLPDNPNQARLYAGQHFLDLMKGAILMMWLIGFVIIFFFSDFLVSRIKILMD